MQNPRRLNHFQFSIIFVRESNVMKNDPYEMELWNSTFWGVHYETLPVAYNTR